jgi:hypothetical protein
MVYQFQDPVGLYTELEHIARQEYGAVIMGRGRLAPWHDGVGADGIPGMMGLVQMGSLA